MSDHEIRKIAIDLDNVIDASDCVTTREDGVNDGFEVDTNKMIVGQWYSFIYKDDKYFISKNEDGSINMGTDVTY